MHRRESIVVQEIELGDPILENFVNYENFLKSTILESVGTAV